MWSKARIIHSPLYCGDIRPRIWGVLLGRASSPYRGKYVSGALGRKTPQLRDLTAPRYEQGVNDAG